MGGTFKWEIYKNVKKNKIGRLCWEICEKKKNCPTLLHSPLLTSCPRLNKTVFGVSTRLKIYSRTLKNNVLYYSDAEVFGKTNGEIRNHLVLIVYRSLRKTNYTQPNIERFFRFSTLVFLLNYDLHKKVIK